MAGPIARRPPGLLDLLLTQQQGKNPSELGDVVSPVMDLTHFYGSERLTVDSVLLAVSAVGAFSRITVPDGETWLVHFTGMNVAFNAAAQSARIGLSLILNGILFDFNNTGLVTSVGATDVLSGTTPPIGLVFPSGAIFEANVQQFTIAAGANLVGQFKVFYTRLES